MIRFMYDIPKNKIEIKTDNKDVGNNTKQVVIAISVCATALIGLSMYIEYQKYLADIK